MGVTAILVAGGHSARMKGTDKMTLKPDGVTVLERCSSHTPGSDSARGEVADPLPEDHRCRCRGRDEMPLRESGHCCGTGNSRVCGDP